MPRATMRDGNKLHYLDIGRGPTCLLLHGFAMPAVLWLPTILPLTRQFRFVLPNLRGFGASHTVPMPQADVLDQYADDLADLISELQLDDFALAGLSMGACTSLSYLGKYGDSKLRSYLNIDQAPKILNTPDWPWGLCGDKQSERFTDFLDLHAKLSKAGRYRKFSKLPKALRQQLWQKLALFYGDAFYAPQWKRLSSLARHELLIRRVAPTANWSIYLDCLHAYATLDYDFRPALQSLKVPVTAFVGMESSMYPAEGQLKIKDYATQTRIQPFANCGHAIPTEQPAAFRRHLKRHLQRSFTPAVKQAVDTGSRQTASSNEASSSVINSSATNEELAA